MKEDPYYKAWKRQVVSKPELDGGGWFQAQFFGDYLQKHRVNTIYEWCCGPAWIGLWLLELGIGKELVVSDVNPAALACVRESASRLGHTVRVYESDNLKQIPHEETFDLIVANPPNYSNIQESHPSGYMRYDLRPSDLDWKLHREFYQGIRPHLRPEGKILISEVGVEMSEIRLHGHLYDKRSRPAIEDFQEMWKDNGLRLVDTEEYYRTEGIPHILMEIESSR